MENLKVALDWTPNTNHIGFLVAKELGYYNKLGLEVAILNPKEDNYNLTPGKKLESNVADFAIAPFETVISLNNKANKVNAIAVYAILQEDLSSIACLKSSNISSPKQLDGKVYASYKARYEDRIVQELIKKDGGSGNIIIKYPEKLGIWETLLRGNADATWIFNNWEGVAAAQQNMELNTFSMADYGIPYGYSPVVIAKKETLENKKEVCANFIKATKAGFLFVKDNLIEVEKILKKQLSEKDLISVNLKESIATTAPFFGNETTCGIMDKEKVVAFLKWLVEQKLEEKQILTQELFTNELFI